MYYLISPIAGLVNLKVLDLFGNNVSDLSPLAGLINLEWLTLERNNVSDLSPLAGLINLESLGFPLAATYLTCHHLLD